ncbi:sickle tail protein homolog isoform X1 [Pygocentrus nattereri]|uniref:Actin interacting protein 3-like C-terminal domain-containing protein n=2 Tax=Pygocentrus nattereri TaxID=42514 RepID=A0AAR2JYC8_PYGNA|nr:sickle tail protein homolog isoform X1 [Pygocentrus nattereri]XP_037386965.1 sickle tail protein homolog isoform X1 [Pygocentrus nattereri]
MSKPSRLVKPSKQSRKELPGNRSQMLIVGERLMRAGSEGNLVRPRSAQQQDQQQPAHGKDQSTKMLTNPEPVKGKQRPCSAEDVDSLDRRQGSRDERDHLDPWSPRTVPRRHTVAMQPHNVERRREAFLEHLKQKYPHHASTIMGHQERLREHIRGPVHGGNQQPGVVEQGEHSLASLESLEVMSEGEAPASFTRGSRTRASLPAVKSSNHTKDRSLGVLYLQYGEETRQMLMPNEVTTVDTVRALFVSAFPQQLTLKMLESPSVAIYIKDHARNVYYELTDIRNITPHSCLKLYHKDPAQAFNHTSRSNNGDARISRDKLYGTRQPASGQSLVHTLPAPHSPIRTVQGSMSPPAARSMPSSPSRLPYGSRSMGSATLPRERLSSAPPARSITPCSSAILERRDVKPDEDLGSNPYSPAEARLSSSQDVPDGAVFLQHRYSEVPDAPHHSLYRQKSRKYSENQLGSKTPPPSPHRVGEVRMIDIHPGQNAHMLAQAVERASPVRRSFRKDSNGTMEAVGRVRGNMGSPVFADLPPGHGDRPFQGLITADPQSKRMKAMEQQIASLTGLVQHALLKGTNTSGAKDTASEKSLSASPAHSVNSGGVSPVAVCKSPAFQTDPSSGSAPPPATEPVISSSLTTFHKNVSNLRQQLHQLRHMQLQNQDAVRLMLQQMEEELMERVCERLQLLEDPLQKQRIQVDEERHRYLAMEEAVLLQLGELEKHVENLKMDSMSVTAQRPITLKDVEEGAVNLRKVGEALAALKGEFPELQLKMRSVLRVEVEAVRFLKEEPHKMDSMLKRVKALTETLGSLRRCATEGNLQTDPISTKLEEPDSPSLSRDSPTPQPRSPAQAARSELTPSSPMLVQRARSTPVSLQPCQLSGALSHHASPPLTPTHGRDTPTVAKVSPRSREDSPALQKKSIPHIQEEVINSGLVCAAENTTPPPQDEENTAAAGSDKAAEKAQLEDEAGAEMERILQQAQANLMKAIPDLEVTTQEDSATTSTSATITLPDEVDCPQPPAPLPEATAPAEPVAEKPVQASAEKPQKPPMEKPHRASVDRVKPGTETASKSPPPPPPRRFYPQGTGLTTGRSGEVIYTTRKESTPAQQEVEEGAAKHKPQRVPPEVKPKPHTPPPISARDEEEEDEDEDKIIAELQVFEKCPVKDLEPRYVVDLTTHELPDTEATFSVSSYDPKNTAHHSDDGKHTPDATSGSGVMYYITGTAKIPSDNLPKEPEVQKESGEGIISSSKVANLNASDFSQRPNILTSHDFTLDLPKSVEEGQKESNDNHQIIVSPLEPLKDTGNTQDDALPKGQLAEDITNRPEKQVVLTSENLTVTEKSSTVGFEAPIAGSQGVSEGSQGVSEGSQGVSEVSAVLEENECQENEQQVVMRSSRGRSRYSEDASLSPDLPGEEAPPPPPPDNIAFMITKTKVKALSNGEYQQLVSSKGQDVETVKVGTDTTTSAPEDGGFNKKPVIIVFDEPMDIRQAYKRLSTIFECEEELDKMLSEEPIDEESEEAEEEEAHSQRTRQVMMKIEGADECRAERKADGSGSGNHLPVSGQQQNPTECSSPGSDDGSKLDSPGDAKHDSKKKFKLKFPKKQLAAIGQALRTGTKTGKKTLQVVVYEDEEEPDGTVKQAREAKRFEIKAQAESNSTITPESPQTSKGRTNDICKTTYKTLDSLEETIKQLETTISDMDPALSPETLRKESKTKRTAVLMVQSEGSPSKRPTPQTPKPQKPPQRKKVKAQSTARSSSSSSSGSSGTKQNTSGSPSSTRISSPRSRQQAGSAEKPSKPQKIQDSQRQFRQVVLL